MIPSKHFFALLILVHGTVLIDCVVVDGDKKQGLSAIKKQKSEEQTAIDPFNTKTCGLSNPNAEDHEFVNMAREGQFPWIVSFQIGILQDASRNEQIKASKKQIPHGPGKQNQEQKKLEDLHFCSGSFISDRWILSAAHCFVGDTIKNYYENKKLKVIAGSHKVSSRYHLNKNLTIERIYYHAKFSKALPVGYDIALVELSDPVPFDPKRVKNEFGEQKQPYMNTICLPLEGKKYSFNETARIAGWGLSSAKDSSTMPSKLLTTDILFSDQDKCVEEYVKKLKSDKPLEQKKKEDDFLCASYKNTRDACQSDSGGPLMQYVDKKAVVVGVVSYGIGCATKGVPGLYTRTSAYIPWIKEITKNGTKAKVDFKVYEKKSPDAQVSKAVHRENSPTTTKKPPPPSSEDRTTTERPVTSTTSSAPLSHDGSTKKPEDEEKEDSDDSER